MEILALSNGGGIPIDLDPETLNIRSKLRS